MEHCRSCGRRGTDALAYYPFHDYHESVLPGDSFPGGMPPPRGAPFRHPDRKDAPRQRFPAERSEPPSRPLRNPSGAFPLLGKAPFFPGGENRARFPSRLPQGNNMEEHRLGTVGIVVEDMEASAAINAILHQHADLIVGRLGIRPEGRIRGPVRRPRS